MLRLIGAAAVVLAATSPVFAQGKGDDKGRPGNGKPDHAAMERGNSGRDGSDTRSPGEPRSDRADDDKRRGPDPRELRQRTGDDARVREAIDRADYRDGRRGGREERWDREGYEGGWTARERIFAAVPGCPPGLARRHNGCLPPGIARQSRDEAFGFAYRPALFGVPLRAAADYVFYDGYLIPTGAGGGRYLPLLGGALAVGQVWPEAYPSLPLDDWQRGYYGFDDPDAYRYADNVVYAVDPGTSAIESVVALLTGSDFAVGEQLPEGYDVYNVPAAYQDRYADSDEALYRYADGRVYEVDPVTMLIQQVIELIA